MGRLTNQDPLRGAAFPHEDGKGYNIVLQALPIDGRVVLRAPKEDDAQRAEQPAERGNVSRMRRK